MVRVNIGRDGPRASFTDHDIMQLMGHRASTEQMLGILALRGGMNTPEAKKKMAEVLNRVHKILVGSEVDLLQYMLISNLLVMDCFVQFDTAADEIMKLKSEMDSVFPGFTEGIPNEGFEDNDSGNTEPL